MDFLSATGIKGLQKLFTTLPTMVYETNAQVLQAAEKPAFSIFQLGTPYRTGELYDSEGTELTKEELVIYADKDYGVYQDRGFKHWRDGDIPGFHYTDKTVDEMEPIILAEINLGVQKVIMDCLAAG